MSGPLISSINSGLFLHFLYVFVLPGAILWFFRSLFVVGRPEKLSEHFLIFIISSALYAMLLGLPLNEALKHVENAVYRYLIWLLYVAVIPACLGIVIGMATQRKLMTRLLTKLRFRVKTGYLTAWEWVFDRLTNPVYVLITFNDGSKIYGYFGENSLASSDPEERNLYLEEVWDYDEGAGSWKPLPEKRGILVNAETIRHIEVWDRTESVNGQATAASVAPNSPAGS